MDDLPLLPIIQSLDLESSGSDCTIYPPVGLGICTLLDWQTLDLVRYKAFHSQVEVEIDCQVRFWDVNKAAKQAITVPDPPKDDPDYYLRNMIIKFVEVTRSNERLAENTGRKLHLISDNAAFDPQIINELISRFSSDLLKAFPDYKAEFANLPENIRPEEKKQRFKRLPWSFLHPNVWGSIKSIDSSDVMFGMVPDFNRNRKVKKNQAASLSNWDWIVKEYDVPKAPENYTHDHIPDHDAYVDAWQYYVMLGIKSGMIKKKRVIESKATSLRARMEGEISLRKIGFKRKFR